MASTSEKPQGNVKVAIQERPGTCPRCPNPSREILLSFTGQWLPVPCASCAEQQATDEAQRQRAARRAQLWGELEVPKLYDEAYLETFIEHGDDENRQKQARVVEQARRYVTAWPDVPQIVVFSGGCGTGKGHILWALAKALTADHLTKVGVFVLSDVIRDLREAWGSRDEGTMSEAQRLRRYRMCDLLVIDEVSRHAFFGQPQQHLYDLVAHREVRLRPTILTSNHRGEELADVLGPALSSRVLGWCGFWDFGDDDYRVRRSVRAIA